LRPSEIILQHLESAAFSRNPGSEVRLPTIRELAQRLGVGVSTVGAVYRDLAQQGRIRTEVGNGSFLLPAQRPDGSAELRIGIGLSREDLADPDGWYSRIYGSITVAALRSGKSAAMVPLDIDGEGITEQVKGLHAIILMPGRLLCQPLVEAAAEAGIPAVYLNAPRAGATENFVSADFAGASEVLGRAFLESGRKDVLILLSDPWHLSVSAHYRMSGLLSGLRYGTGNGVRFRLEIADGFILAKGREAMRRVLADRCPDAIYTSGDFLAMGCVEELEAHGYSVPDDVSVVGGSGLNLDRYSHPGLTCCAQPYEQIGSELIGMVHRLLDTRSQTVPGVVVPMGWVGGTTTLAEENQILMASSKV